MTHRTIWYAVGGCVVLILVSVGVVLDSGSGRSASAALTTGTPPRSATLSALPAILPTTLPAYIRQTLIPPIGSLPPAPPIKPSDGVTALSPTAPTTDPHAAAFTEQDVRAYLQLHPFKSDTGAPLAITAISFLTVGQANAAAPVNLNFANNQLVCLIRRDGTFTVTTGLGTHTYSTSYDVLNAQSGNLLVTAFR